MTPVELLRCQTSLPVAVDFWHLLATGYTVDSSMPASVKERLTVKRQIKE
jgi:hypothetical protein